MVVKIHWKTLFLNLLISLETGGLSAFLSREGMQTYESINKPALSPPGWVFGVVWSILFFLMGISAYLICETHLIGKQRALKVYVLQLAVNFFWSIFFFNAKAYWLAFAWLVLLWVLVFIMIRLFFSISKWAARLQMPYLIWITFAGYLSFSTALLN